MKFANHIICIVVLGACSFTGMAKASGPQSSAASVPKDETRVMAQNTYVGMWVTEDGYIRHELLPNGRYDEARGNRQSTYQGRYTIEGDHIEYMDDTGFTADGDFRDGVLHHGGMIFSREEQP
jgi:Agrobacterium tumefaciens protein Atu4866